VFDEMAPEIEGAVVGPKGTGVTVPVPKPTVIESRIVRQPGSPTLADITPPKVHPSNLPKKTEPPKPTVPTEPPKPAVPKEPPKPAVPKEPPKPAVPAEPTKPAVPTQKERAAAKGKQEEAVAAKQKQESERKWRELQEAEQRRKATEPDRKRRQEEAAAKRKQEEPAPKEKPKAKAEAKDPEATAKKSARDKAREETERKIKEIEQEKKKLDVQDSSLRKAIRELNEKIERLNDELLKATEGDKPRILKEIEEAENTLNVNKGGGLRAELEGTSIKQWELTRAKKNLLEALKLERPSLRESTKRAIEEAATKRGNVPGGRETKPPYRFLDRKGKPIEHDQIHYGHSYGQEHRRLALQAQEKGMNQAQFNDWVNSHPEFFQIESEAENLSHAYEKPGID
jgi:HNH/ENDO VII superfamily nuclease with conserved GHE residues